MAKAKRSLTPEGRTYKVIELVGTSTRSYEEAVRQAITDAQRTVRGMSWFELVEQRGRVTDAGEVEFQARVQIGFRVLTEER